LTARPAARTLAVVRDGLRRARRGFLFGFSAALGAWVAIVLVSLLVLLLFRPFGR
jgi:threonine/homoserine/homoserine lactone efflux protein